jgi:predicted small lipoprotein YifL
VLSSRNSCIARIAAAGALMLALAVAGCGRKGGLDPPPASSLGGAAATLVAAPMSPAAAERAANARADMRSDRLVD